MKFYSLALFATAAFAAKQLPEVDGADTMWTNDMIKVWVAENHGGVEWDAFHDANLVTDGARQAFVENLATKLVAKWMEGMDFLPKVCEPGIVCRKEISAKLVADLEEKWGTMISSIDDKLMNKKVIVDAKLEEFYSTAYDCEAGCTCDNIKTEYDQIINWQDDLSARIVEYSKNLTGLITNEKAIIASCPAYIYDSDGNAFFDYEAPVVPAVIDEPDFELIDEAEPVDGGNDTLPTDEQDVRDLEEDTAEDVDVIGDAIDGQGFEVEAVPASEPATPVEPEQPVAEVVPTKTAVCAQEGASCDCPIGSTITYADITDATKSLDFTVTSSSMLCDNTNAGGDPSPQEAKQCSCTQPMTKVREHCAVEGAICDCPIGSTTYYGATTDEGSFWLDYTVTRTNDRCSNTTAGGDPFPGANKVCECEQWM